MSVLLVFAALLFPTIVHTAYAQSCSFGTKSSVAVIHATCSCARPSLMRTSNAPLISQCIANCSRALDGKRCSSIGQDSPDQSLAACCSSCGGSLKKLSIRFGVTISSCNPRPFSSNRPISGLLACSLQTIAKLNEYSTPLVGQSCRCKSPLSTTDAIRPVSRSLFQCMERCTLPTSGQCSPVPALFKLSASVFFRSCCTTVCKGHLSDLIYVDPISGNTKVDRGCESLSPPQPGLIFDPNQPPSFNARVLENNLQEIFTNTSDNGFQGVKITIRVDPMARRDEFQMDNSDGEVITLEDALKGIVENLPVRLPAMVRANNDCFAKKCGAKILITSQKDNRHRIIAKAIDMLRQRPSFANVYVTNRREILYKRKNGKRYVVLVPFKRSYSDELSQP